MSALFADFLPLRSPIEEDFDRAYLRPGTPGAWLGTDVLGRDLLSRMIHGARISLQIAFTAPFIQLFFGLSLGMCAGYFRGRVESSVSIFVDSILAFPNIVAIIAILFFVGPTMLNMIIVFGFFGIPGDTRLARANTILFAEREFVLAARAQGASHFRILVRELLPNVIIPLISLTILGMSGVIVAEGGLVFLGLSLPPPTATWGRLIAAGFNEIERDPHITFVPAFGMFLTILALNMMADKLRQVTDVRESQV